MSIEIVTGKAGEPHVSSADDGRRIAGECGDGSYVLTTGGKLVPTLVDSNTVQIATGDCILQGRHVSCTEPSTVKIANGSQGKKRVDYVCAHYTRDAAGSSPTLVETMELVVLQGTPADSSPKPPTVPAGSILDGDAEAYIPIVEVDLDGLTTGTPKLLIPELKPLAEVWDSVSQKLWSGKATSCTLPAPVGSYGRLIVLIGGDASWIRTCVTVIPAAGDNFTVTYSHRNDTHVYLRHADLTVSGSSLSLSSMTQEWMPLNPTGDNKDVAGGAADEAFYILGVWRAA